MSRVASMAPRSSSTGLLPDSEVGPPNGSFMRPVTSKSPALAAVWSMTTQQKRRDRVLEIDRIVGPPRLEWTPLPQDAVPLRHSLQFTQAKELGLKSLCRHLVAQSPLNGCPYRKRGKCAQTTCRRNTLNFQEKQKPPLVRATAFAVSIVKKGSRCFPSPLGRPGNDLLSRVLRRSTIGAGAFHGRVRNGIGCSHPAIATRSTKG